MNPSLLELAGRVHPLLIHFPIAFLLLTAALEVWRLKFDNPAIVFTLRWSATLGALGVIAAAASGWIFSAEHHRSDTALLLEQHRWAGIATAVLAVGAMLAVLRWSGATDSLRVWLRRSVVWATAILLIVAAHLGAMVVWGDDFFTY